MMPSRTATRLLLCVTALVGTLATRAYAHEHHEDEIEEGHAISDAPIDTTLWVHIIIQTLAWGVLFPTGMVLGIVRSRWHVPVQTLGASLALVGHFLGHKHHGRQFKHSAHSAYAPWLEFMLVAQVGVGILLKLHIEKRVAAFGRIRKPIVMAHGVLGKALPLLAWVQMLFGGIVAQGFCRDDHLGQCVAHFIMGSAFVAYGIVLTILLLVGQAWLRRTGRSQEFFDSAVIAAWGMVNTFTEHRWGGPWVHNDLQHTAMGIIWWSAGLVGIWLSRTRDGKPKRNLIPGIVILLTGYAMSAHPQNLPLSTMVHTVFGYTLMAAGLTRIIEISFVLRDAPHGKGTEPSSWQYLPTFLLYASGFMFMGATEEQMQVLSDAHVSHVAYTLILYSVAFLLFLFVNLLIHVYTIHTTPADGATKSTSRDPEREPNGHLVNGHTGSSGRRRLDRQAQDAEEFELHGLISDDEDEEGGDGHRKEEPARARSPTNPVQLR